MTASSDRENAPGRIGDLIGRSFWRSADDVSHLCYHKQQNLDPPFRYKWTRFVGNKQVVTELSSRQRLLLKIEISQDEVTPNAQNDE